MYTAAHASCTRRLVTQLLCVMIFDRCELLKFSLLRYFDLFLWLPVRLAYLEVSLWLEFDHSSAEVTIWVLPRVSGVRLGSCMVHYGVYAGVATHRDVLFIVCLSGNHDDLGWRVVNFAILR